MAKTKKAEKIVVSDEERRKRMDENIITINYTGGSIELSPRQAFSVLELLQRVSASDPLLYDVKTYTREWEGAAVSDIWSENHESYLNAGETRAYIDDMAIKTRNRVTIIPKRAKILESALI